MKVIYFNLWQVIEPQFKAGLTETHTRSYLPLIRDTMLENKDSKESVEFFKYIIGNHFEFLKVN